MLYHFVARPGSVPEAAPSFLSRGAAERLGLAVAAIAPLWVGLALLLGWVG